MATPERHGVVGVLTRCALLDFVYDLKATQMNLQRSFCNILVRCSSMDCCTWMQTYNNSVQQLGVDLGRPARSDNDRDRWRERERERERERVREIRAVSAT